MKKIVCFVLLFGILLTLCSCAKTDEEEELKYIEILLTLDSYPTTRVNWREMYNQVSLEHNIEYIAVGYVPHVSACGESHDYESYDGIYFYFYQLPNGRYYYVDPVCEHLCKRWSLERLSSDDYYVENDVLYHKVSDLGIYDTSWIGRADGAEVIRFYYK